MPSKASSWLLLLVAASHSRWCHAETSSMAENIVVTESYNFPSKHVTSYTTDTYTITPCEQASVEPSEKPDCKLRVGTGDVFVVFANTTTTTTFTDSAAYSDFSSSVLNQDPSSTKGYALEGASITAFDDVDGTPVPSVYPYGNDIVDELNITVTYSGQKQKYKGCPTIVISYLIKDGFMTLPPGKHLNDKKWKPFINGSSCASSKVTKAVITRTPVVLVLETPEPTSTSSSTVEAAPTIEALPSSTSTEDIDPSKTSIAPQEPSADPSVESLVEPSPEPSAEPSTEAPKELEPSVETDAPPEDSPSEVDPTTSISIASTSSVVSSTSATSSSTMESKSLSSSATSTTSTSTSASTTSSSSSSVSTNSTSGSSSPKSSRSNPSASQSSSTSKTGQSTSTSFDALPTDSMEDPELINIDGIFFSQDVTTEEEGAAMAMRFSTFASEAEAESSPNHQWWLDLSSDIEFDWRGPEMYVYPVYRNGKWVWPFGGDAFPPPANWIKLKDKIPWPPPVLGAIDTAFITTPVSTKTGATTKKTTINGTPTEVVSSFTSLITPPPVRPSISISLETSRFVTSIPGKGTFETSMVISRAFAIGPSSTVRAVGTTFVPTVIDGTSTSVARVFTTSRVVPGATYALYGGVTTFSTVVNGTTSTMEVTMIAGTLLTTPGQSTPASNIAEGFTTYVEGLGATYVADKSQTYYIGPSGTYTVSANERGTFTIDGPTTLATATSTSGGGGGGNDDDGNDGINETGGSGDGNNGSYETPASGGSTGGGDMPAPTSTSDGNSPSSTSEGNGEPNGGAQRDGDSSASIEFVDLNFLFIVVAGVMGFSTFIS